MRKFFPVNFRSLPHILMQFLIIWLISVVKINAVFNHLADFNSQS
jgi:hypothetical protein